MAKRSVVTNKGLQLLGSSSEATGQYWWLGYYALAYSPNLWKASTVVLPNLTDRCGNENGTVDVSEPDEITPNMTHITKDGDVIYNIFQSSLTGTGFYDCGSDGSVGGDLFGLAMYPRSIRKHYRYVLDKNGNNTLVTWTDPADATGKLLGAHVYLGTDGYVASTLPIPAPLYYMGDTEGNDVSNYFPNFEDADANGSSIFPYIEVDLTPVGPNPAKTITFPRISVDHRGYTDSKGNDHLFVYTDTTNNPTNDGFGNTRDVGATYFDSLEIPSGIDSGNPQFEETDWYSADLTRLLGSDYNDDADAYSVFCNEFWKAASISNYNRFHAPTNSVGQLLNSDLASRNIAKVTKLFPISNYKVINSEKGTNTNSEIVDIATAITVTIDLDVAPDVKADSQDDLGLYDRSLELANPQTEQQYPNGSGVITIDDEKNIFDTTNISFKFNRIGIYAVPLRKCPFTGAKNTAGECNTIQFEIDPNVEPVLYAVVDWDHTVTLDQSGDGVSNFRAELNINLESPTGDNINSNAIVKDTTIFYNLYEDDALKFYKNQLISTASMQTAIVEIGLELQHLKNRQSSLETACVLPDLSRKYSQIGHTHDNLKNLKDGNRTSTVRSVGTPKEFTAISILKNAFTSTEVLANEEYYIGDKSIVFGGVNNVHASTESFIGAGSNNIIYDSFQSSILSGSANILGDSVSKSAIITGSNNRVARSLNSIVGGGDGNKVIPSLTSYISVDSGIFVGKDNKITASSRSAINSGYLNTIDNSSNYLFGDCIINSGSNNEITNGSHDFIGAGYNNLILNTGGSYRQSNVIVGGESNYITNSIYSIIGAGKDNTISNSQYCSIPHGQNNMVASTKYATVLGNGGKANHAGSVVQSSGYFESVGDAQRNHIVLRGITTSGGGNEETLTLDGVTLKYDLSKNFANNYGSFSGEVKVSAFSKVVTPKTFNVTYIQHVYGQNTLILTTDTDISSSFFAYELVTVQGLVGALAPYNNTKMKVQQVIYGNPPDDVKRIVIETDDITLIAVGNLSNAISNCYIHKLPASWLFTSKFSGFIDATLSPPVAFISGELMESAKTAGRTIQTPTLEIDGSNLSVVAYSDIFEELYWVATIDVIETGILA